MKHYEIWTNRDGNLWLIYEIEHLNYNHHLIKTFKTKKGAENWAKKQWYRVVWR